MYSSVTSKHNLLLAWRRVTTANDARYKKFFRRIYESYELAAYKNVCNLSLRLRSGEYVPNEPVRLYYPKSSGLQRPITLLSVEDQIVLQCLANVFAREIREKRKPLLGSSVFSNWENDGGEIFFLQDWKKGFGALRGYMKRKYREGYVWVASFDLSAFYETIDHELLLKLIAPRGGNQELVIKALSWLKIWSSEKKNRQHSHGIPQGPIASDYLAEAFMLPIDLQMADDFVYARYVDDIRILGRTPTEVRKGLVILDKLCRERGLIPNADKFTIREVKSEDDLVVNIPDLFSYFVDNKNKEYPQEQIEKMIFESIKFDDVNSKYDILDRSKFRYGLFRLSGSDKILGLIFDLLPNYPENIDAYSVFFENYSDSQEIIEFAKELLYQRYPYEYVRGELWKLLASTSSNSTMIELKDLAIQTIQDPDCGMAEKIGCYAFLCSCDKQGLGAYSRWVGYEPLAQALTVPYLDLRTPTASETAIRFLKRSLPDVSLAMINNLIESHSNIGDYGLETKDLSLVSANSFHVAGLVPDVPVKTINPVGTLLCRTFAIKKWDKWKDLLGSEYNHAHQILVLADNCYALHRSEWLGNQDSFNNILFGYLLTVLGSRKMINPVSLSDKRGLVDYGKLLNDAHDFRSKYPTIANNLIDVHNRRRTIPSSHPYDKKTGLRASPLRKREQSEILQKLSFVYSEIITILDPLI